MNNSLSTLIIVIALLLPIGCKKKEQVSGNIISINPHDAERSVSLSELVDSIYYIKLETSDESLMARLREIIIKNTYIYAIDPDQKIVCVFDKKGNFISKLDKHGESPSEYAGMQQILVDDNENYVEIFDYGGTNSRVIRYENISFKFLEERPIFLPNVNTIRKERDDDIYYFSTQQAENSIGNETTNADIIAVRGNESQNALFEKKITTDGSTYSPNTESFYTNEEGEIFAYLMFNNTFFKLSSMKVYPVLTVDFGKYSIDNSIGLKSIKEQREYLYSDNSAEGMAFFPVLNINNSKMLAFSYNFKENGKIYIHHYIQMKNNNEVFHVREIQNDVLRFPDRVYLLSYTFAINHEVFHNGYLADIILPSMNFGNENIETLEIGKIDREDNPIIIMMKLKDQYM